MGKQGTDAFVAESTAIQTHAWQSLRDHFDGIPAGELSSSIRTYPDYMRPDIQAALSACVVDFQSQPLGINQLEGFRPTPTRISGLFVQPAGMAVPDFALTPLGYDSIDVGEDESVTVFGNTLWLIKNEQGLRAAIYFSRHRPIQGSPTASIEIAFRPSPDTAVFVDQTFSAVADAIANTRYYRNKILSFEDKEQFAGEARGITVHRLEKVRREDVILSKATMDSLDLHVFEFAKTRAALATLGQSLQKGILLYGPPGTGKTHTIRYLASNLENHTTFLITANQVGKLREYIEMARLLQPATIVIEDVDLIGRDRTQMREAKEEALLNRLLNEMDGLNPSSQIFFILTTNRPADIEEAISNRPGRIDQAIEVPPPDAECRIRLLKLYGKALEIPSDVAEAAVAQTEGVSAAFMKELVRRLAQQSIMRGDAGYPSMPDLQKVVDEIVSHDQTIGRTLLGGMAREHSNEVQRGSTGSRC